MINAQAPIAEEVHDSLKICFITDILNSYGMTETMGASVAQRMADTETGHVGGPLQNTKVRLKDVPEMGYLTSSNPPRGEICFKGSSVMDGYFNNSELNAEAFDADGWLLSGDIGEIDEDGRITVIDRKKSLFKLDHGDYIAPEKVESIY